LKKKTEKIKMDLTRSISPGDVWSTALNNQQYVIGTSESITDAKAIFLILGAY
jgi:hypothetical protein